MVGEFLTSSLSECGLFLQVRCQVALGLRDGIKGGLGKVAQGVSAVPWLIHSSRQYQPSATASWEQEQR